MGCSKRYLLAATLFMLVSSTVMPAMSGGPEGIDPPGVVLPGKGEPVTMELDVVGDSVVLTSTLDVAGGPVYHDLVTEAAPGTTLGFMGEVEFDAPDGDLSWYLGTPMDDPALENASRVDDQYVITEATRYGYQLYLLDTDPKGMVDLAVTWTGRANATVSGVDHTGARLYIFHNASTKWELLDGFEDGEDTVRVLTGSPVDQPWHYVNRTLSGKLKVILIVMNVWDGDSTLSTDAVNMTVTYAEYPLPQLDVGADGHIEWGFGINASTGALGYLDAFNGDRYQLPVDFPLGGGTITPGGILLPRGVEVSEAFVDYMSYPSVGERSSMGRDVRLDAYGGDIDLQVGDIPNNSHQRISSVLLTDVTKYNVTEQTQEVADGTFSLSVGHAPNGLSLGQTFEPAYDGPLNGIDVFITDTYGSPGDLTLRLWNTDQGKPTGAPLRSVSTPYHDVVTAHWKHFSFPPVWVSKGDEYAYTLHAQDAPSGDINTWVVGFNQTAAYPNGSCLQNPSLDGSSVWTPLSYDLCFRTYMDLPIAARDANLIMVDGVAGNLVSDRVYFNISSADYTDGNWTFEVDNLNPFEVSFNWSAWTRYILFAELVMMDVGADGSTDVGIGSVAGTVWLDLTEGIQGVLDTPDWPLLQTDTFGNVLYRIPLDLTAASEGRAVLHNLVVRYEGSLTTTDLSDFLNEEKGSREAGPDGIVRVPINITSMTAGTLNVTSVDITYDLPPHSLHIDDLEIPEDETGQLALDTVIFDDFDNNALEYSVVKEGGDDELAFNITDDNVVEFWGPANWSGSAMFHISVEDRSDLSNRTNTFNVTVLPVNDPPRLIGLTDQVVFYETLKQVPVEVLDNDTAAENITIATSTERVWYDAGNGTLSFLYPNGTTFQQVEVNVSDGEGHSVYWINVTPRESDEPPVVTFPPGFGFNISLDAQGTLDLTPFATDLESGSEELVWALVSAPPELVAVMYDGHLLQLVPVATEKGDHEVVLSVTDPDDNTVSASLLVRIRDQAHHPPEILRGEDALPLTLRVERDDGLVVNLALQKYWYDQEDYNRPEVMRWEVTSLRPSLFTVEIGKDQELIITAFDRTGAGYITLRLLDSDGDVSKTESVRIEVVEASSISSSWFTYLTAALVLIVVVGALMLVTRRRSGTASAPKAAKAAKPAPGGPKAPAVGPGGVDEAPGAPTPPVEAAPGRIVQVLMIHESTSLMTQMTGESADPLSPEKEDELIELATLFAQDRFEDANVGTIKAFKFNGDEVLVGKGKRYFLVTRCTGTEFDGVVSEMKRSIVNIDVGMGDRLDKWYPGQRVTPLEGELRELLSGEGT